MTVGSVLKRKSHGKSPHEFDHIEDKILYSFSSVADVKLFCVCSKQHVIETQGLASNVFQH